MRHNKCIVDREKVRQVARDMMEGKILDLPPIKPSNTDRFTQLGKEVDEIKRKRGHHIF
jgi:hypothetical protein